MAERTDEEKDEIRRRFSARRRNQWLLVIPIAAVMAGFFYMKKDPVETIAGMSRATFQTLALVIIGAALVFSWFNWRCPACSGYLGRSLGPRFCPKCGAELS
jgi:hypothetical protein